MKKQREIIQDRAPLSDAEITQSKQPFEKVLDSYTQMQAGASANATGATKGLSSLGSWGIGIATTALVGGGIWYATTHALNDNQQQEARIVMTDTTTNDTGATIDYADAKKGINPPLPDYLEEELFTINNRKQVVIETENGSTLTIPAKSFVDKNGKSVTKDIKIRYNDFHNPLEIFLSGIPMDYDSAGTRYNFESAGMFQVFAENNGEPLYLKSDKVIEVELVSYDTIPFNQYYYDTVAQEWKYMLTEDRECYSKLEDKLDAIDTELASLAGENEVIETDVVIQLEESLSESSNPINAVDKSILNKISRKKKKAIPQPDRYSVKVDNQGDYSGVYQLLENQDFKPEYYNVRWHEVSVKPTEGKKHYTISFRRGQTKLEFQGEPVLSDQELAEAVAEYTAEEEAKLSAISVADERREKVVKLRQLRKKTQQIISNKFVTKRRLQVRNMGSYNCDRPYPEFPLAKLKVRGVMTDTDGNAIAYSSLNVAEVNRNVLWTYPRTQTAYYSGVRKNILWTITDDNKVAILTPDKFSSIKKGQKIVLKTYAIDQGLMVLENYFN